jgi:heme exporter protein D
MAEVDITAFGVWSAITLVVIVITGLVYRTYRRKQNATSSS